MKDLLKLFLFSECIGAIFFSIASVLMLFSDEITVKVLLQSFVAYTACMICILAISQLIEKIGDWIFD
jgi:hypothetical protein